MANLREFLAGSLGQKIDEEDMRLWAEDADKSPPQTVKNDIEPRMLGEFELISVLGVGGMGKVYRASQPT